MDLALASFADLTERHADEAARSSASMREFLAWAARHARPEANAPRMLIVVARLARADWVEGSPIVEVTGTETETRLSIFADHGMGIRERVLPLVRLAVPFDEFEQALMLAPDLAAPFHPVAKAGAILLRPSEVDEETRETIAIDERSLHEQERKTAPPPFVGLHGSMIAEGGLISDDGGIHTHPTVRRMVAVRPEALRPTNDDD